MNPERWKRIEALFESALERAPAERAAFLDEACGNDPALRQEVESLLAHQQPTGAFISTLVNDAVRLFPQQEKRPQDDARFIPGTVLAGRYRIIGQIGKGGMGEVYRADDLKLGQPVALKFLPENLAKDAAMLERFHREVRIARQISHPNICRVFDIGEVKGHHFLTMEYIDGEDLASLLRRIGRLPADKAVEIARQLCAGLAAAHDEGVLHRDLKPANVMVDGRGKARITDFGLSGLAGEFHGVEVRAGTPAYMAPEQLAGREVSVRSDIYSLGLVLYEIFTGKKAFEAATLEELIKLHESSAPPSISDYVKEVDPLVERVILRCLEREPSERPATVAQVAAALPGGDPLAAALAAGETPSPEMVAAVPKEGGLRPAVAVACLAAFFIELALIIFLSGEITLHSKMSFEKSPEVLADQAAGVVKRLGYTEPPADSAYRLDYDEISHRYLSSRNLSREQIERLVNGPAAVYHFWYRQSPRPMELLGSDRVSLVDPPANVSGMVSVILDTRGRLTEFHAVPPQVDRSQSAQAEAPPSQPNWALLFEEAGLDMASFTPAASNWLPHAYADARAAWEGSYAEFPEIPIRVEAAAYRGRPVYFQVITPWTEATRQEEMALQSTRKAAAIMITALFFSILIAAVLIARHNLRAGRGDRKGGARLAFVVFSLSFAGALIGADHVATLGGELNILYQAVAWSLFLSLFLWVLYIALEPFVRRLWPRLIISWSRFVAGGFRDPMVGRDLLIGSLLGFGHTLAIYIGFLMAGDLSALVVDPNTIQGGRHVFAIMLNGWLYQWFLSGLGILFLLLLLYIIVRRKWLAVVMMWLLAFSIDLLAFTADRSLILWVTPMVIATLIVIAVARFGLLTTIAFQFFFNLSFHFAITPQLSSWHAQTTFLVVPLMVAIAVYSFYTSLAGQPLFKNAILQD